MSLSGTDLLGYLVDRFNESKPKNKSAEKFLEFARGYLQENKPVSFDHLSYGLAVTLSNGARLPFCVEAKDEPEFQMYTGEVPVTDTNRSQSFNVFTGGAVKV